MREPPTNRKALDARLRNAAAKRGVVELRLRRTVAHTIVGQMLPAGVVKGAHRSDTGATSTTRA